MSIVHDIYLKKAKIKLQIKDFHYNHDCTLIKFILIKTKFMIFFNFVIILLTLMTYIHIHHTVAEWQHNIWCA